MMKFRRHSVVERPRIYAAIHRMNGSTVTMKIRKKYDTNMKDKERRETEKYNTNIETQ